MKDIDSFDEYPFISFKKKVIFKKLLESCLIDECDLPDPGCAYKYTEMIVYQSSKEIGFINYKTKKVIK